MNRQGSAIRERYLQRLQISGNLICNRSRHGIQTRLAGQRGVLLGIGLANCVLSTVETRHEGIQDCSDSRRRGPGWPSR